MAVLNSDIITEGVLNDGSTFLNVDPEIKAIGKFLSHNFAQQMFLLSNVKQTTSQNVYILYESLAGNQRNSAEQIFSGKQFSLLSSSMKLAP